MCFYFFRVTTKRSAAPRPSPASPNPRQSSSPFNPQKNPIKLIANNIHPFKKVQSVPERESSVIGASAQDIPTMQPRQLPVSIPQDPNRISLCNIPTEIRFDIFNYLLTAINQPRTYGYTGIVPSRSHGPLRKHAMLLASKQLSAEYRQCFYERTTFFLRIDRKNVKPSYSRSASKEKQNATPNFWDAPDTLIQSLRHCTLYIEVSDIKPNESDLQALISRVLSLLEYMQQLRSVHIVWDTSPTYPSWKFPLHFEQNSILEACVKCLKGKPNVGDIRVKVGGGNVDTAWSGKKEEGVWKGLLVKTEGRKATVQEVDMDVYG